MGGCSSCEATAVAAVNGGATAGEEAAAARVVLADGALRRFPGGTRASQAVKAAGVGIGTSSSYFLCSADGLELAGAVAAVAADEELQPGQLYFVLPVSMRRRPLQAEDMAALAVRASAALVGDHDGPLVFPEAPAAAAGGKGCRRSRRGRSRGRDFVPDLSAITE
ncbi:hypothetical protein GUJ93_ZPchr0003g18046 [Zizania palustris]|uniref:Uncharacterized protein n=1 Tax=Zizania palustris TaxID=103762 RepID=A0A8J5SVN7_ZIZPA|nr:hypothetical protein GUJ93_ZPchr0003g18046 [Zizania palustris]